jgi:hypothetical protein
MSPRALLLAHLAATLFMTGVIWVVQVVHYPLFGRVSAEGFPAYEGEHTRRITWVVGPAMAAELAAAILLVYQRPPGVPGWQPWAGLALLAVVWLSTAFLQVPRHRRLAAGYDPAVHAGLVATNWVRTVAWSLRGALALAMAGSM